MTNAENIWPKDALKANPEKVIKLIDKLVEETWEEPKPLLESEDQIPEFKEGYLPNCYRKLVADVAHRMSSPPEMAAMAAICAFSGAVSRRGFVYPKKYDKEWKVTLNLWGAVVALPGRMKTPIFEAMTKVHYQIESEWAADGKAALEQYEQELSAWESSKKYKDSETDTPAPRKPTVKRLILGDTTPEAFQQALSENPRGVLVLRDELSGLLAEMEKKGHENQRAMYLHLWGGNTPYNLLRISRGSVSAILSGSVFGNLQPDSLSKLMEVKDGLLQRFQLLVAPTFEPFRNVDVAPNYEAIARVEKVIRFVANLPENSLFFHFNPEAQTLFDAWLEEHQNATDGEPQPQKQGHLGKYRSLMPILAALFQLADVVDALPDGTELEGEQRIDADHAKQAIGLCGYLQKHLDKIYSSVMTVEQQAVSNLATRIKRGALDAYEKDGFSVRDIRLKGWSGLTEPESIKEAIQTLEEAHWIRQVPQSEYTGHGGRPTQRWIINPAVCLAEIRKVI